jgi:hypothetical protein
MESHTPLRRSPPCLIRRLSSQVPQKSILSSPPCFQPASRRIFTSGSKARTTSAWLRLSRARTPAGPASGIKPNLIFIKADQAWAQGISGSGVTMAVFDTGLMWDHPAIQAYYRGWNGNSSGFMALDTSPSPPAHNNEKK